VYHSGIGSFVLTGLWLLTQGITEIFDKEGDRLLFVKSSNGAEKLEGGSVCLNKARICCFVYFKLERLNSFLRQS
jgi:hypothetical protein